MHRVTPTQEGMFFHSLTAPRSGVDVAQVVATLHEQLDLESFRRAWQHVVNRHEALRMRFRLDEKGYVHQFPLTQVVLTIDERDWSQLLPTEQDQQLEAFLCEDRVRGFDLRVDLPSRVSVFRYGESEYRFVWTWWHGMLDGRSNTIVLRELFSYYDSFRHGQELDLPLPRRFVDFPEWLATRNAAAPDWWKELLQGFTDPTPIGAGRPSAADSEGFGHHTMRIPPATSERFRQVAKEYGATLNTLGSAAWALVLSQFSGQDDVVFGSIRACRHSAFDGDGSAAGMVGALINLIPVRVKTSPSVRVCEWLKELRGQHLAVRPFEHTPLSLVQASSAVPAGQHLFDSILVCENQMLASALGAPAYRQFRILGRTAYPLTVYVWGGAEVFLELSNDRTRVDDQTAERMLAHLAVALEALAGHMEDDLSNLQLLPAEERELLLEQWNRTECPFPADSSIQACFEQQAACTPDAPALTCRGETWTYRQLDQRADAIAHRLHAAGAGPETVVGACMERSLDLVAGLLGILKTGAAYLPLDPAYPLERLAFIIQDSHPLTVLSSSGIGAQLAEAGVPVVCVDAAQLPSASVSPFHRAQGGSSHLAYVIYTSGSTGKPKGVMVEHRNVMNFFAGMDQVLESRAGVWLAVTSISFDISVLELWWSLTRGFHVVLWQGLGNGGHASIPELIRTHGVTHLQCVPSLLRAVMMVPGAKSVLATLRLLVVGGEAVPKKLIDDLGPSPSRRIFDMYGPTETTVWSTTWEIKPDGASIAIGRPIANTQVFILDRHRRPVPVGVAGELYIGGAGVVRGYLNRPELTAERFVSNPFTAADGERLYRTGDLARYRPDGTLEYIGRLDNQVKIRGHRVELGEIEVVLARHPDVRITVVDAQEDALGEIRLVAYVVPGTAGMPETRVLREFIGRELPAYMVPAAFVPVHALPRTPNGKLDRKALPRPDRSSANSAREERTATPVEAELARLWCEALGVARVGLDDDFFDLGGDSLVAVRMVLAIQRTFGVDLPLDVLFQAPTVTQLAEHLASVTGEPPRVSRDGTAGGSEPRTATERRLLAIWQNLLGVQSIGIHDSFFSLQGRSMLFEQMLAQVRSTFGVFAEGLPVNDIIDNPTIEALARIVDSNIKTDSSLVVGLQPRGFKPPLFLIHAGAGYVFFYRALASRLGPDRPVYGIRAASKSDDPERPFDSSTSIEELAERYISEMKAVRAHGPYLVGGGCLGGVVAFEMARQLHAHGEEVGPVLLFDAFVENNPYRHGAKDHGAHRAASVWQRAGAHLNHAARLKPAQAIQYLSHKMIRIARSQMSELGSIMRGKLRAAAAELDWIALKWRRTQIPSDLTQRRLMEGFLGSSLRLLSRYTPGVYEGRIVLLKAAGMDLDAEPYWTGLARGGMVVHKMPGGHLDMMEEPAVEHTAALVRQYLEESAVIPAPTTGKTRTAHAG